jgi:D-3-phosphoglycerate dehydrogenase
MNKQTVLVTEPIDSSALKRLTDRYNVISSVNQSNIKEINAVLTRKMAVSRDFISKAVNLKVIANHGSGADQIDLQAAKEYGVKVLSAPGLNALSVAELVLGFFINLSFKIKYSDEGLRIGQFTSFGIPELQGNEISGKNLGLIGSGNIARHLAKLMSSFNMNIYCWNPHKSAQELNELGFKKVDSIKELLNKCDFVSIHIPLNSETKNLINGESFSNANPNLILVNTSRGGIVNETDLYAALVNKKIKGAACDVFTKEPPSKDLPLLHLANFLATPHIGGSTKEALERVGNKTVDNIISVLG